MYGPTGFDTATSLDFGADDRFIGMTVLSRREFLRAGALGALGVALARCGGDSRKARSTTTAVSGGRSAPNLLVSSFLVSAATDQRVAMLLRDHEGFLDPSAVEVRVGRTQKSFGEPLGVEVFDDTHGSASYFIIRTDFDAPGDWWVKATLEGKPAMAPVKVVDPATDRTPAVGQPLPATPTPTTSDALGIDPICTRSPVCDLHATSLEELRGSGKPIAVLFATPAFCESATCGPVLDVLLAARKRVSKSIDFVHVEIYTDRNADITAAPVRAFALPGEPILFLAGSDGNISTRLDGLFGETELVRELNALS